MKGSIQLHSSGKYRYIDWYINRKHEKIYDDFLHGGDKFWHTHPDSLKCIGYKMADRCLTVMRNDWEAQERGERTFDIGRYRGKYTDVIPYVDDWFKVKEKELKPGTVHVYQHSVNKIKAFFEAHPMHLHQIKSDTIALMASELELAPKTKRNILELFKEILETACDSDRIPKVPKFPTISVPKKPKQWIDKATQEAILAEIPAQHQPIFRFMQLHWRRLGETIALHREDYDKRIDAFIIHRALSGNVVIDSTKTDDVMTIPCHPEFNKYWPKTTMISPYFFTCASSHAQGKRYTPAILMRYWKKACSIVGVSIDMHRGLRTSGASQAINENGFSVEEVQKYGRWANIKTVQDHYGDYELERVRSLMNRVIPLVPNPSQGTVKNGINTK